MKLLSGNNLFLILVMLILILSCADDKVSTPLGNLPPETDIFISSQDTLNYTQSIQHIFWDGRDPDGFVTGFYYSWIENPQPSD